MQDPYPVQPFINPCHATVRVPGSKSITNRALAIASILPAKEEEITEGMENVPALDLLNFLRSRDTEIMFHALKALGKEVEERQDSITRVSVSDSNCDFIPSLHVPLYKKSEILHHFPSNQIERSSLPLFREKTASINVGNAGTAARFLTAILCLEEGGNYEVDGDEAMYRRPMKGLTDALASLGAEFEFHKTPGCIPFTLRTHGIKGDRVAVDASESSQILSALLIMAAGVGRPFEVELTGKTVSEPFVEMTAKMLESFGAKVTVAEKCRYTVTGFHEAPFVNNIYDIEPDATAASYFLALPIATGGTATVADLGNCRLQGDIRFVNVLRSAGLSVEGALDIPEHPNLIRSTAGKAPIRGVRADFEAFSDTFLTLAALTPLLDGVTRIEGIAHTRKQETDRVAAMARELRKLGQEVKEEEGALEVRPNLAALKALAKAARDKKTALGEGAGYVEIDTYKDHRFAMSFAVLGCRDLLGDGKPWLAIRDPLCCKKTFPNFFEVLEDARQQSQGTVRL